VAAKEATQNRPGSVQRDTRLDTGPMPNLKSESTAPDFRKLLLDNLLDSLDDLYDRRERAELWTLRLLAATSEALKHTTWHDPIEIAAAQLLEIVYSGQDSEALYKQALTVTGDLRLLLAAGYQWP
jgi:hypothetical protein